MAVTGSSDHLHQHDSIFYGLSQPLDPQGNPVVPQAGDLWIVTPMHRGRRWGARHVHSSSTVASDAHGHQRARHHRPDDAVENR